MSILSQNPNYSYWYEIDSSKELNLLSCETYIDFVSSEWTDTVSYMFHMFLNFSLYLNDLYLYDSFCLIAVI